MAELQYIGARYVPLFFENPNDGSNNWLSGYAYDALTIVTDINQSYTSKIPVPATVGRPSENPTYWVLTGAYNAQVEEYREEVENYTDYVNQYIGWENRKVLFVGDSYDSVASDGQNISDKAASYIGCSYTRISQGGYGFTGAFTGGTKKWITLITAVADKDSYTDIVFFGGLNDMDATFSDLQTEMIAVKNYITANFQNVKTVFCGFCGWIYGNLNTRIKAKTAYEYYNSLIPLMGWNNLNNLAFVARDPSLFIGGSDLDHPGASNTPTFGKMLAECMLTGSCEYYHKYSLPVSFNTTYFQSATANMTVDIHNNICSLYLGGVAGRKELVADLNTSDDIQFITGTTMAIPFNDDLRFFMAALNPSDYNTLPFILRQSTAQTLSLIPAVTYTTRQLYLQQQTFTYSL